MQFSIPHYSYMTQIYLKKEEAISDCSASKISRDLTLVKRFIVSAHLPTNALAAILSAYEMRSRIAKSVRPSEFQNSWQPKSFAASSPHEPAKFRFEWVQSAPSATTLFLSNKTLVFWRENAERGKERRREGRGGSSRVGGSSEVLKRVACTV